MPKSLDSDSNVSDVEDCRTEACRLLHSEGLPCTIWGEDALAHHGIPTFVFDVFLLVNDVEKSKQTLLKHGFEPAPPNPRFKRIAALSSNAVRIAKPVAQLDSNGQNESELEAADRQTGVILLLARDWHYEIPKHSSTSISDSFPSLWDHLNSLISVYQSQSPTDYAMICHIAVHIGYFYLYTDEIWQPDSEKHLLLENRQLHLDYLAGKRNVVVAASHNPVLAEFLVRRDLPSSVLQQYYQRVRDLIQKGEHVPAIVDGGIDRPQSPLKKPGQDED